MNTLLPILIGLVSGIFGGFFGLGGGLIMVPALIFLLGMTQHQAQGTAIATMIPPIGLLAALKYYQTGNVNLKVAIFMCLGFFFGGLLGAEGAHLVSDPILKKLFGVVLLSISIRLIIGI